jgi:SAM-dependent methyltransferase
MNKSVYQKMQETGFNHIVGGGDPREIAQQNFTAVQFLTQLQPDMSVLDFGCGCGRLALPVLDFLSEQGIYVGVDIIPGLVKFCQDEIAPQHPNASFFVSADRNDLYDKFKTDHGQELPRINDLLDLGEGSFDVITAFSVFTHLKYADAVSNLAKLARLLKPGGKILLSCFLINSSSRELLAVGNSSTPFGKDVQQDKQIYFADCREPLTCVGFQERELVMMGHDSGLQPFVTYYGHWCGRPPRHSFQDIMVFENLVKLPAEFDARRYLQLNPDLPFEATAKGKILAERHFLEHGYKENRAWK